jgi:hypothetical protein
MEGGLLGLLGLAEEEEECLECELPPLRGGGYLIEGCCPVASGYPDGPAVEVCYDFQCLYHHLMLSLVY